jgi:type IV pilus secretin PilQ/predicted competence protein
MIRVNKTLKLAFALGLMWTMPTLLVFAQNNKELVEIETGAAVSTPTTVSASSTPVKAAAKTAVPSTGGGLLENVLMADGKILVKGKNLSSPKVSTLDDGRILLVFKNSGLAKPPSSASGSGLIKGVRWASHGKDAHVVLLAESGVHGTVEKIEGGYSFVYGKDASKANVAEATKPKIEKTVTVTAVRTEPTKTEEAPVVAPPSRLIGQALKPMENGWKIILTMDSPARYKVLKLTGPDRVLVHFSNTKMDLSDKDVRQKLEGAKAKGLLQLESRQYMQKPQPIAEVALTLAPGASFQVDRDANQVVLIVTNVPVVEKSTAKAGNLNQLVTVDVDTADIKTVLKSLGQEAGYDTDISDVVAGTVNQHLKDVPLRTALAVLLTPGGYQYEVQGNLLRVGSATYLLASKSLMPHVTDIISVGSMTPMQLDTLVRSILPATNASKSSMDSNRNVVVLNGTPGDISEYKGAMRDLKLDSSEADRITRVVKLNYADPAITRDLLKPYLTPMGNAQVDIRSQSVVLWESASNMGVLLELIKEIDVPLQQVLIESTIVEVNIEKLSQVGVDWTASRSGDPSITGSLYQPAGTAAGLTDPGTLAFGTLKSGFNINATLSALESHSNGKIISRPKIATSNGQAAMIQTVENVVYITASTTVNNGTTTTTYASATVALPIVLNVTPRITDDGRITSNIAVTITSETVAPVAIGGGTTSQPETTTQQAQTTVTVKNGETIVIGGLVRDTVQETIKRVPLLGSLPILGTLFRNTSKDNKKVELIIFITPTLLEN